jgi:hypothetical protein
VESSFLTEDEAFFNKRLNLFILKVDLAQRKELWKREVDPRCGAGLRCDWVSSNIRLGRDRFSSNVFDLERR